MPSIQSGPSLHQIQSGSETEWQGISYLGGAKRIVTEYHYDGSSLSLFQKTICCSFFEKLLHLITFGFYFPSGHVSDQGILKRFDMTQVQDKKGVVDTINQMAQDYLMPYRIKVPRHFTDTTFHLIFKEATKFLRVPSFSLSLKEKNVVVVDVVPSRDLPSPKSPVQKVTPPIPTVEVQADTALLPLPSPAKPHQTPSKIQILLVKARETPWFIPSTFAALTALALAQLAKTLSTPNQTPKPQPIAPIVPLPSGKQTNSSGELPSDAIPAVPTSPTSEIKTSTVVIPIIKNSETNSLASSSSTSEAELLPKMMTPPLPMLPIKIDVPSNEGSLISAELGIGIGMALVALALSYCLCCRQRNTRPRTCIRNPKNDNTPRTPPPSTEMTPLPLTNPNPSSSSSQIASPPIPTTTNPPSTSAMPTTSAASPASSTSVTTEFSSSSGNSNDDNQTRPTIESSNAPTSTASASSSSTSSVLGMDSLFSASNVVARKGPTGQGLVRRNSIQGPLSYPATQHQRRNSLPLLFPLSSTMLTTAAASSASAPSDPGTVASSSLNAFPLSLNTNSALSTTTMPSLPTSLPPEPTSPARKPPSTLGFTTPPTRHSPPPLNTGSGSSSGSGSSESSGYGNISPSQMPFGSTPAAARYPAASPLPRTEPSSPQLIQGLLGRSMSDLNEWSY